MTIQEVIDHILNYHPKLIRYCGCDEFKCGNPNLECTGVVVAMSPTINVIKKAIELGANLIVVHEPTNYTSADKPGWNEDFDNSIFEEKKKLLDEHDMAIWRDHDHMHMHNPDRIFSGVLKYMGWDAYAVTDTTMGIYANFIITLPEKTTLRQIMQDLKKVIGTNGMRYVGPDDMEVKKFAIVGHLYPQPQMNFGIGINSKEYSVELIKYFEKENVDLIIPGETIDWTVLSYIRDAVQLGYNKAAITLGHFNWEELGMRYAREWLETTLKHGPKVYYVPSEDMYKYL